LAACVEQIGRPVEAVQEAPGPALSPPDRARRILQVRQGSERRLVVSTDDVSSRRSINETPN